MSERSTLDRLDDMLEFAESAIFHMEGLALEPFLEDHKTQLAMVRCLEVVGEASNHVPEEIRQLAPEIPWHRIRGFRNRAIHAYFDLDMDVVWEVVTHLLPELIEQITDLRNRLKPN